MAALALPRKLWMAVRTSAGQAWARAHGATTVAAAPAMKARRRRAEKACIWRCLRIELIRSLDRRHQNWYRRKPPSTGITAPVMYEALGEARKATRFARSSGSP